MTSQNATVSAPSKKGEEAIEREEERVFNDEDDIELEETDESSSAGSSSSGSDEEIDELVEEEEDDEAMESIEDVEPLRQEALEHYNKGAYEEAMKIQYRIVRFIARTHKNVTVGGNGMYFLDYGLSQLRCLQMVSQMEDILSPEKQKEREKELEACFVNLDVARVCFQKEVQQLEKEENAAKSPEARGALKGRKEALELSIAETHNALAQLLVEKGDYKAALQEYDSELLIYNCLQSEHEEEKPQDDKASSPSFIVPPGRMVGCLYGSADCLLKEANFEGAEERLTSTLALIKERYAPPIIDQELVEELEDWLADAREMKGGAFKAMQETIQQQFGRDKIENVLETREAEQPATSEREASNSMLPKDRHPFISALPQQESSMPWSLPVPAGSNSFMGNGELSTVNEKSQSISLFPSQSIGMATDGSNLMAGCNRSYTSQENATIHSAVVTKKPKKRPLEQPSESMPDSKRARVE